METVQHSFFLYIWIMKKVLILFIALLAVSFSSKAAIENTSTTEDVSELSVTMDTIKLVSINTVALDAPEIKTSLDLVNDHTYKYVVGTVSNLETITNRLDQSGDYGEIREPSRILSKIKSNYNCVNSLSRAIYKHLSIKDFHNHNLNFKARDALSC